MRKKLKYFIPLALILILTVVLLCTLLPRYYGLGEVILTGYCVENDALIRMQVRETGAQQEELLHLGNNTTDPVFSSNGRYMAFPSAEEKLTRLYDLQAPEHPLIRIEAYLSTLQVTDEGMLVYYSDGLRCHDGTQEHLLDTEIYRGNLQILETTLYYFRKSGETYDLYACSLPNGQPRLMGEDLQPDSLQVSLYEGRHYVTARQRHTLTGTRYDLLIDDAGPEKDELRQQLKTFAVSQDVSTIFRWVDGALTVLAQNIVNDCFVEPVSGTVVHQTATLAQPVKRLSAQKSVVVTNADTGTVWYRSAGGKTQLLTEAESIAPVLTPNGGIYLTQDSTLCHWPADGEPVTIPITAWFTVALDAFGAETLYILTTDGRLMKDGEVLSRQVLGFRLAGELLPGGALRQLSDTILLQHKTYTEAGLMEIPEMTVRFPDRSITICMLQDGVETPLLMASFTIYPKALMANGHALVYTSGWWALGPERSELLSLPHGQQLLFSDGIQFLPDENAGGWQHGVYLQ